MKSTRKFTGASISAADLLARFKIACNLKQTVDHVRIESAMRSWAEKIGAPEARIKFVTNTKEAGAASRASRASRDARAARAARAAWDARGARDARGAWAARDARAAWDARGARDARGAWDARGARAARASRDARAARAAWDMSWASITAIGASSGGDEKLMRQWLPIFEAFEAGAFALWLGAETFYVAAIPTEVRFDELRRLHCADGPAFAWLDDIRDYYWHGVHVPSHWIENRTTLDPGEIIKSSNVEQRAAGAAIVGWPKMLSMLKAKTIDKNPNPDIGELIELTLPGLPKPGRFLKAICKRNGLIVEGVPFVSDIDNLPINTALHAQAWRVGDPLSDYIHPPRRT